VEADASGATLTLQLPIDISVRVGPPSPKQSLLQPASVTAAGAVAGAVTPEFALAAARAQFADHPDVLSVALGYRFRRGWITDERVIAVTVRQKLAPDALRREGRELLPTSIEGMPIDVRTGSLQDQLAGLGIPLESLGLENTAALEGLAGLESIVPGAYVPPPHLQLERVTEHMKARFHVSPDAGWPTLRDFLGRVSRRLTATMFEWDAAHVTEAVANAIKDRTDRLRLVTQRPGTRDAVESLAARLGDRLQHTWASVKGASRLFPTSYHIKVASRDGKEFWLSSGNWKNSGQPDIDPIRDNTTTIGPLREFNREWHAVIENERLATLFQRYIEWDFKEAERVGIEELPEVALPDVFLPEAAFARLLERPEVRYHAPLLIDRELDVQPLLTPDWRSDGEPIFIANAIEMLQEAKERVFLQNQSLGLLVEGDNLDEFEQFFALLADRQRAGLDVRIIFRDPREFPGGGSKLQTTLERCKDLGLDTDRIKVQRGCHTKGLIVDGKQVMLGSHNLTNTGALYNRDASLRVRDLEVAQYFEQIFLYDFDVLAQQEADELVGGMRLAGVNEATPPGFRRVNLSEVFADT
jgi:hypothetical protein